MNQPKPWPPLIIAREPPLLIRSRDHLLTLAIWALFAFFLVHQVGQFDLRGSEGASEIRASWLTFIDDLRPFARVALLLVVAMVIYSFATLWRRRRTLNVLPPPPLSLGEQAQRAGMDDESLRQARSLRIAVVHIEADGKVRVEPRLTAGG